MEENTYHPQILIHLTRIITLLPQGEYTVSDIFKRLQAENLVKTGATYRQREYIKQRIRKALKTLDGTCIRLEEAKTEFKIPYYLIKKL